jgi:hypothetical protein
VFGLFSVRVAVACVCDCFASCACTRACLAPRLTSVGTGSGLICYTLSSRPSFFLSNKKMFLSLLFLVVSTTSVHVHFFWLPTMDICATNSFSWIPRNVLMVLSIYA